MALTHLNIEKSNQYQPVAQGGASIESGRYGAYLLDNRPRTTIQRKQVDASTQCHVNSPSIQMMGDEPSYSNQLSNLGSVVQRKIIYDYKTNQFSHNGTRPAWRSSLKTWTAAVYNLHRDLRGEGHLPPITGKTNIGAKNLARTHKIPFHTLQVFLVSFCRGNETPANLTTFTDLVIKPTSVAHAALTNKRAALVAAKAAYNANQSAKNRFAVLRTANQLLSELHNSIDNVSIGESGRNSAIAERGDWNVGGAAGAPGVLTPISSEARHGLGNLGYDPGLYVTGGNIASSHITSRSPTAFLPHAYNHFTTRNWRGAGYYQNGVVNNAGGLSAPGTYANRP